MLVDKIDFVEFDRQWRGLFDDGCDYELVVNGFPAERKSKTLRTKYTETAFTQWGKEGSGFFLSWAHTRKEEVALDFRKKPEPLPEGWQRNAVYDSEVVREIAYEGFSLRMRVEESTHPFYDLVYTPIVDFICPKGVYESVFRVFTYDASKSGVLTSFKQGIQQAEIEAKRFLEQFVFWED